MGIHNSAIIEKGAELGNDVVIGPLAFIESGTVIGDGTEIKSHAVVKKGTTIGSGCVIGHGAVLGGEPQDVKFRGEESFLTVGDGTVVREYFTGHRGSGENSVTQIGSGCMLMVSTHVGHNCKVGNGVVMANSAGLGGFVEIGDRVFIGGLSGFHQYVRVGAYAMVGGGSAVMEDVPPYMMATGGCRPPVVGLNTIGLMRANFSQEIRSNLRRVYRILYKENRTVSEAVGIIRNEIPISAEIQYMIDFIETTQRGISKGR